MPDPTAKNEIAQVLEAVSQQSIYDAGRSGQFTRHQLRKISKRPDGRFIGMLAQAKIPDELRQNIMPIFRNFLRDFIDTEADRIGNGLVNLAGGGVPETELKDYVEILVRASAVLGGERVADLLNGWIHGEPMRYKTISLLSGITMDETLELAEGLRLYKLPTSSAEVVPHLPFTIANLYGISNFLGGVVLSIEAEAQPALYRPSEVPERQYLRERTYAGGWIRNLSVDSFCEAFCEAMSLVSDSAVHLRGHWSDFGEIREFLGVHGALSLPDQLRGKSSNKFTQNHFERARELHIIRNERGNKKGLDTSIERWIKSKSSSSFSDQLIDLRIALESLYLGNDKGEIRFRLASHAAWHLGENTQSRKKIFATIQKFYSLASGAVHGREVRQTDENYELLQCTQTLCQKGILNRLREEKEPEWNDLIMGDNAG